MLEATVGRGGSMVRGEGIGEFSIESKQPHGERRGEIVLNFQVLDQQIFLSNPSNNIDVN
jgi:hypothetical protein